MNLQKKEIYSNKNILIDGLFELIPVIHNDSRGFFYEAYNKNAFFELGLDMNFVQDNVSFSKKNVLRGMHFQKNFPQGKLIQCLEGSIYDCVIDIRKGSKTFGQYAAVVLDFNKHNSFYIPEGFAHGFLVLSETAMISYKCTDFYHPEDEGGILWNEKSVGIKWPLPEGQLPVLNEKDLKYKSGINL